MRLLVLVGLLFNLGVCFAASDDQYIHVGKLPEEVAVWARNRIRKVNDVRIREQISYRDGVSSKPVMMLAISYCEDNIVFCNNLLGGMLDEQSLNRNRDIWIDLKNVNIVRFFLLHGAYPKSCCMLPKDYVYVAAILQKLYQETAPQNAENLAMFHHVIDPNSTILPVRDVMATLLACAV